VLQFTELEQTQQYKAKVHLYLDINCLVPSTTIAFFTTPHIAYRKYLRDHETVHTVKNITNSNESSLNSLRLTEKIAIK
jgi:hypothetical protein